MSRHDYGYGDASNFGDAGYLGAKILLDYRLLSNLQHHSYLRDKVYIRQIPESKDVEACIHDLLHNQESLCLISRISH